MVNVALCPFRILSLFAGGGGLDLGLHLAIHGARTVCYVEREAYAAAALVARMEEAPLAPAPVWDDVCTFDGRPWRGLVDCVAGGFPCQDISNAGKREGIGGERSGLWREYARIVGEVRPRYVFVENVAALAVRGLDAVLADLAALGFDAEWGVVGADDAGAPHQRDRLFVLAHARASMVDNGTDSGSATRAMQGANPGLKDMAVRWPTPSARDGDARRGATDPNSEAWARKVERGAVNAAGLLSDDLKSSAVAWSSKAATWSTPRTACNVTSQRAKDLYSSKDSLEDQAKAGKWRTPSSTDWKGESAKSWTLREDGDTTPRLSDQVAKWPTPMAGIETRTAPGGIQLDQAARTHSGEPRSHPGLKTARAGKRSFGSTRVLNPQFVEALMGWPIGWSDCVCSAMASSPRKRPSHGECSTNDCAEVA